MKIQELPYWGQFAIVAVLCLVLGWVFYQFIYSGEVEDVRGMESRLTTILDEIRKYKPEESRKEELEFEIEQINTNLQLLEKVFPSVKNDVRVKRFIEEVARDFDILLDSYRASDTNEFDQYFERVISLETRGRTVDFMRFFDSLARKDLVVHIYGLSMSRTPSSRMAEDRYPVTAKFRVSSYIYKTVEEVEGGEE